MRQFVLSVASTPRVYWVVDGKANTVFQGEVSKPNSTILVGASDFLLFAGGELDAVQVRG